MSTTPLSVAIVGCGIIGVNHARAIARVPGLRIAAAIDTVPGAADRLADLVESELHLDRPVTGASISDAQGVADVVVVCTPSGTHVDLARQGLEAGLHVVLEKPLDVSMARGRELAAMAEAAADRGLVVSVISQHRFDPASVVVADAVRAGRLGRVTSAVASVAWWRSQEYYDSGAWRGTWELDGGGALMNQGVHTVDLLLWLLGEPIEVHAHTGLLAHERVSIEDVAVATVRFASGALAVLHATTAAFPGLSVRLQVHGSQGSAVIDDDQLGAFYADGSDADLSADAVPAGEHVGDAKAPDSFIEAHARQYRDIEAAIREVRPPGVGVADALQALALVRSVYVSATLGRAVRVADVLGGTLDDAGVATEGVES
jgi:UDP-N-acetyl-2-amino-2-deoxyglucuronate dehydrogenase